ncbi:hypothetical protein V2G26_013106 [Clonostachys chloroleuca]
MRFNILSAVTVALSASTTYAQLIEPKAVVDAIDKITDLSNDTADAAEKVQQVDITAIVPAGFRVVKGFKDIISTVTMTISDLGRMDPPKRISQRRTRTLFARHSPDSSWFTRIFSVSSSAKIACWLVYPLVTPLLPSSALWRVVSMRWLRKLSNLCQPALSRPRKTSGILMIPSVKPSILTPPKWGSPQG